MDEVRDYFTAKEHNIRSFFVRDIGFRVPDYQRSFAWTKDELDQFWDDFKTVVGDNYFENFNERSTTKPHFFGTILLTDVGNDRFESLTGSRD